MFKDLCKFLNFAQCRSEQDILDFQYLYFENLDLVLFLGIHLKKPRYICNFRFHKPKEKYIRLSDNCKHLKKIICRVGKKKLVQGFIVIILS